MPDLTVSEIVLDLLADGMEFLLLPSLHDFVAAKSLGAAASELRHRKITVHRR
jgi:hypothetical protein